MHRTTAVLLLAAAALIGVVVYGFVSDTDPVPDDEYATHTTSGGTTRPTHGTGEGDDSDAGPTPNAESEPLVPRVLPPDAAIEDVRDAYAARDLRALQATYERVTRLTTSNASYKAALQRAVNAESDTHVAALVNSAMRVKWDELDEIKRAALLQLKR